MFVFQEAEIPDVETCVETTPETTPNEPANVLVDMQSTSAAAAAAAAGLDVQDKVTEGQMNAVTYLCHQLNVCPNELLTEDIKSHTEFMKALTSVGSSAKIYYSLTLSWQENQSFVKRGSMVASKQSIAESKLADLSVGLIQLSKLKVSYGHLGLQLQSCQQKLNKMMSLLPCMFESKHTMEEAIPTLQASVRAQKARKVKRLTGAGEYILVASNSLGLSWESAMSKLTEVESLGESSKIVPLSLQQLKAFPSIKDMCHHSGLRCIPRTVLQQQYDLKEDDTLKKVIQQLVDVFPLLGVVKGAQFVLIDYTELVFNPNVVHELLTLKQDNEQSDKEDSPVRLLEKPAEGIMFYKKTGPQPLQEKFPQLLDVIVNFVRLHGFGAHTRGAVEHPHPVE